MDNETLYCVLVPVAIFSTCAFAPCPTPNIKVMREKALMSDAISTKKVVAQTCEQWMRHVIATTGSCFNVLRDLLQEALFAPTQRQQTARCKQILSKPRHFVRTLTACGR
jgi:hypothetical protein